MDGVWSPDGRFVAGGSYQQEVQVWEASTGSRRWVGHGQPTTIRRVAWSPDGTRLASGGGGRGSGELFAWCVHSGELLHTLGELSEIVYALVWSPTGAMLISGGSDGMLCWWDVERGKCVQTRRGHQGTVQSFDEVPG